MGRKTKCLNVKCGLETVEEKLIEVNKLDFDFYDVGIVKYTNKDKDKPWVNLVCPKCKHSHYYN